MLKFFFLQTNTVNLKDELWDPLYKKNRHLKDIGFSTFEMLFHICFTPIIDNCSGVWGHQISHKINMVQDWAIQNILGVHRMTPILAILTSEANVDEQFQEKNTKTWFDFRTV